MFLTREKLSIKLPQMVPRASARGTRGTFFISYVQFLICRSKKRRSNVFCFLIASSMLGHLNDQRNIVAPTCWSGRASLSGDEVATKPLTATTVALRAKRLHTRTQHHPPRSKAFSSRTQMVQREAAFQNMVDQNDVNICLEEGRLVGSGC